MRVTVLGRHAPYPPAGGACNGYLVQSDQVSVLVDAGYGVASRLQEYIGWNDLTAVVLTHLHPDHIADVHCLRFPIWADYRAGRRGPLPIHTLQDPADRYSWLVEARIPQDPFLLAPIEADQELRIGGLSFRFVPTKHALPCNAVRVSDGHATVVFGADSGPGPHVTEAARGADLAILEATLLAAQGEHRWPAGHMTAMDAARHGREAGVRRLLLTHLHPAADHAQLLAEARLVWADVELAGERQTYEV